MKSKKVPMRLCVGCGTMQPKKDLIRVLKNAEGEIKLDFTGKQSGRGAYLCKNMDCFAAAKKGHRIERSFGCRVSEEVYEEMDTSADCWCGLFLCHEGGLWLGYMSFSDTLPQSFRRKQAPVD